MFCIGSFSKGIIGFLGKARRGYINPVVKTVPGKLIRSLEVFAGMDRFVDVMKEGDELSQVNSLL